MLESIDGSTLTGGGVVVVLLIQIVNMMKSNKKELRPILDNINKKVEAMYAWHDVTSPDGRKIWYQDNSQLCKAIERVGDLIENQTKLFNELVTQNKIMVSKIDDLK